jgi:hypothetical protein
MNGDTHVHVDDEHDSASSDSRRGQSSESKDDHLAAKQADDRHDHRQVSAERSPLDGVEVKERPYGTRCIGDEVFCVKKVGSRPYCHFCGSLKNIVALIETDEAGNPKRACSTCVNTEAAGELGEARREFLLAGFGLLT